MVKKNNKFVSNTNKLKIFNDPIYGFITIPNTLIYDLIQHPYFQRLRRITQMGLSYLVYPGAHHTRFHHALGCMHIMQKAVQTLQFKGVSISEEEENALYIAILLHDIGHWPFCHAIEDIRLVDFPKHEVLATRLLEHRELAELLRKDWDLDPAEVAAFLDPRAARGAAAQTHEPILHRVSDSHAILRSMLSGPVDIDKLDYLERDSLHAGVPYGRNFDRNRLVHSLCVDQPRNRIAISEKGRTAAEMMVFARYVMFSEVYWHHAVRSATAMIQRAVFELRDSIDLVGSWLEMDEATMTESLIENSRGKPWENCILGLFGMRRSLYKRIAQFDRLVEPDLHSALARRPYQDIVSLSRALGESFRKETGVAIGRDDVLIDAPPVKLEVQFDLRVRMRDGSFRNLVELSPVVQSLATEQFDALVKRVRVFVAPHLKDALRNVCVADRLRELIR